MREQTGLSRLVSKDIRRFDISIKVMQGVSRGLCVCAFTDVDKGLMPHSKNNNSKQSRLLHGISCGIVSSRLVSVDDSSRNGPDSEKTLHVR